MRERKIVKLRVDMYEDTKFKIIDMKPERDLIQYIWTRLVTLAGKVNLEGDLYMSKNLPYTIETLAIEFNRDFKQIKLALDTFIELEMIELTEVNIYRVKNFAKHQNIKVKETINSKDEEVKNKEIVVKEALENKITQIPLRLETKRNKTVNKKKEKEKICDLTKEEDIKDNDIVTLQDYDEKRPLPKGETLISSWSFR